MKRFKIVGLCLVAAFAVSAVAASGASAANPEFLGTFPIHFSSLALGESSLKAGGNTITCLHVDNLGVITGPKTGSVDVTFLGCKLAKKFVCNNEGNTTGSTITTSLLSMSLGYTTKPATGVLLLPAAGGALAEFTCHVKIEPEEPETTLLVEVKGGVIGAISPTNVKTSEFEFSFAESGGEQAVQKLEGEGTKKHVLEVFFNKEAIGNKGVQLTKDMIFTGTVTELMA